MKRQGFTIYEVLVTIVILGVVAVVAQRSFVGTIGQQRRIRQQVRARALASSFLEQYKWYVLTSDKGDFDFSQVSSSSRELQLIADRRDDTLATYMITVSDTAVPHRPLLQIKTLLDTLFVEGLTW